MFLLLNWTMNVLTCSIQISVFQANFRTIFDSKYCWMLPSIWKESNRFRSSSFIFIPVNLCTGKAMNPRAMAHCVVAFHAEQALCGPCFTKDWIFSQRFCILIAAQLWIVLTYTDYGYYFRFQSDNYIIDDGNEWVESEIIKNEISI